MNFKKIGIALCASATFGLVACGDSDSSSGNGLNDVNGGDAKVSCEVQKNPFKTITKGDGYSLETSITYDDGEVVMEYATIYDSQLLADKACEEVKGELGEDDGTVKCEGKSVVLTTTEEGDEEFYESIKEEETYICNGVNEKPTPSSGDKSDESDGDVDKKPTPSSDSKSGKSSSSVGADESGFTYIEFEGGSYRGHGCDFKMSDKTWEYAYEERYGKMIVETKVVCEDLDDEDYSFADKICTKTITYDDEESYEDCEEEKTENYEVICKDGLTIEKYFERNNAEDLFKSNMKFCQRINLNPDWEYVPEGSNE